MKVSKRPTQGAELLVDTIVTWLPFSRHNDKYFPSRCGLKFFRQKRSDRSIYYIAVVTELDEPQGLSINYDPEILFDVVATMTQVNPKEMIWVEHFPADGEDEKDEYYLAMDKGDLDEPTTVDANCLNKQFGLLLQ